MGGGLLDAGCWMDFGWMALQAGRCEWKQIDGTENGIGNRDSVVEKCEYIFVDFMVNDAMSLIDQCESSICPFSFARDVEVEVEVEVIGRGWGRWEKDGYINPPPEPAVSHPGKNELVRQKKETEDSGQYYWVSWVWAVL
jgi:hypothetical protein